MWGGAYPHSLCDAIINSAHEQGCHYSLDWTTGLTGSLSSYTC